MSRVLLTFLLAMKILGLLFCIATTVLHCFFWGTNVITCSQHIKLANAGNVNSQMQ